MTPTTPSTGTQLKEKIKIKPPELFDVILLNDDETTVEFVIYILVSIFKKDRENAVKLMEQAHNTGKSIVGTYTYDIALTKVRQSREEAVKEGYPLELKIQASVN